MKIENFILHNLTTSSCIMTAFSEMLIRHVEAKKPMELITHTLDRVLSNTWFFHGEYVRDSFLGIKTNKIEMIIFSSHHTNMLIRAFTDMNILRKVKNESINLHFKTELVLNIQSEEFFLIISLRSHWTSPYFTVNNLTINSQGSIQTLFTPAGESYMSWSIKCMEDLLKKRLVIYPSQNIADQVRAIGEIEKMKEKGFEIDKLEENNSDNECSICTEKILTVSPSFACKHTFHSDCILKWMTSNMSNNKCPCCRQALKIAF